MLYNTKKNSNFDDLKFRLIMTNLEHLQIKNFRGFDSLEIEGLSKINLFVGKNNLDLVRRRTLFSLAQNKCNWSYSADYQIRILCVSLP